MKRVKFILAAVFISLTVILFSCGDEPQSQDGLNTPESNEAAADLTPEAGEEIVDETPEHGLPVEDLEGYVFKVISRGDDWHSYPVHSRDIIAEQETGDTINDAVYKRNSEVEDRLNIKITLMTLPELTGEGEWGPIRYVERAHMAGEDNYDLLVGHEIYLGTSTTAGYYSNWYDIPYIDLTNPWWNQEVTTQLSIGRKAFLAMSDLSISSYDNAYCILFNKLHHQNYQVEDLYELVESGQWTFDKMYSIYKGMYIDLDNDGLRTINDFYGFIEGGGYLNWFFAGGNRIMKKDENNVPYYELITERSTETFSKASEMTLDPGTYRFNWWINEDIIPMFASNNGLFLGTQIGSISQLRSMEVDFGIIPYPKLNAQQQDYHNFIDAHSSLMAVPQMVEEKEKVGLIIETLSYESYKTVRPAYYDVALKTKMTRDDESEKMLDIIFNGTIYDFDYVYGDWIVTYVFFDNLRDGRTNFVSGVERNMTRAERRIEQVLEAFEGIDG